MRVGLPALFLHTTGIAGGYNRDQLALDLQFAADRTLAARIGPTPTFTRASAATFIGSNGLIQSAAINAPRFDHDPVTLASRGLLIEESRTNLLPRSEEFNNGWAVYQSAISANSTASPSGLNDADSLIENTANDAHSVFRGANFAASTVYSFSVYVKADSRNWLALYENSTNTDRRSFFNVATGTVGTTNPSHTAQIQRMPNGWWRCSITFTTTTATSRNVSIELAFADNVAFYSGNGTGRVSLWGAQLEVGAFPTSYIPTTTTAVVRSADVCSITGSGFAGMWNASEGTLLVNAFTPANGDRTILATDDNTANEMIRLRTEGTNPFFRVTDGGTEVVGIDAGTVVANTPFRLIGAYRENDFASAINGGSAVTDTTGTIPTVDRMRIGAGQGGNVMCGCISSMRYYRTRLSNAQLQSLTT